jgi:transposase
MPATQATSIGQRQEMMRLVAEGHTYASVAEQVRVSFWTARKWIRMGKRYGEESLARFRMDTECFSFLLLGYFVTS